jgi:hypothetical protein
LQKRGWRIFAAIFIASGIIVNTALALDHYRINSLYANRSPAQSAIDAKNYLLLGERRSGARY